MRHSHVVLLKVVLRRTQLVAPLLVAVGCSPDGDVVGAETDGEGDSDGFITGPDVDSDSDSDTGPGIPTSGNGLSGRYRIESLTVSCAGDCSAPGGLLGPVSYCDVGTMDTDYSRVEHDGESLQIDFDAGRAEGTIDQDGQFMLTGEATESGGAVDLEATVTGSFTGRHEGFTAFVDYSADGLHDGDLINCHGQIEIEAFWESDECTQDPSVCPEEYPLCVSDSCNAGIDGDECWDEEDCAAGFVCNDSACRLPGEAGEDCQQDEHCAAGLFCVDDVCSAGNLGDPCHAGEECQSGICYSDICTAGDVGDGCSYDDHCAEGNYCVDDVCSAGNVGDACNYDEHCDSEICYDEACSAGEPGDPCTWDDECLSDNCLDTDRCA